MVVRIQSHIIFIAQLYVLVVNVSFMVAVADINITCHQEMDHNNIANKAGLALIDVALDELYDQLEKDANYMDNCTYEVTISDEEEEVELTLALERFEVLRSSYEHGLWGYCAKEGAEDLILNIQKLKNDSRDSRESGNPYTICDRDKMLSCHPRYEKCTCLIDNRNFRNTAANYWNDTQQSITDPRKSLGESQCVLILGSDCPIAPESPFLCMPGTNCLFKSDMSPCVPRHKNTTTNILTRNTRAETSPRRYSFINDHYPTVHCQCYGFESKSYIKGTGTTSKASVLPVISVLFILFTIP